MQPDLGFKQRATPPPALRAFPGKLESERPVAPAGGGAMTSSANAIWRGFWRLAARRVAISWNWRRRRCAPAPLAGAGRVVGLTDGSALFHPPT